MRSSRALDVGEVIVKIGPLALAGRVIHERDHLQAVVVQEWFKHFQKSGFRKLRACSKTSLRFGLHDATRYRHFTKIKLYTGRNGARASSPCEAPMTPEPISKQWKICQLLIILLRQNHGKMSTITIK